MNTQSKEPLRDEIAFVGNDYAVLRICNVQDKVLTQTLRLMHKKDEMVSQEWRLETKASHDDALQWTDRHWKQLIRELQETVEQALLYRQGHMRDRAGDDAYVRKVLDKVAPGLLVQVVNAKEASAAVRNGDRIPLIDEALRVWEMREVLGKENKGRVLKLDRFERMLIGLDKRRNKMWDAYDVAQGKSNLNPQDTAGEHEFENEDAWRGDIHGKEEPDPDMKEAVWTPELKPELVTRLDEHLRKYVDIESCFVNSGVRVWMKAVKQIKANEPVTANAAELAAMEGYVKNMRDLRKKIHQDEEQDHLGFELRKFNKVMDDPEHGLEARMRKVIAVVSRPGMLEAEIRKGMSNEKGF